VQLNASQLNAVFGVQVSTNLDVVDVDCNQFEAGAFASTPIPAAGTRNRDVLMYPSLPNVNQNAGSIFAIVTPITGVSLANRTFVSLDDGTENERIYFQIGSSDDKASFIVVDNTVSQASINSGSAIAANVGTKMAAAYALNDFAISAAGNAVTTDNLGTLPTTTVFVVGERSVGANAYGCIKELSIWKRRLPDATLVALTS
jgi:hypothetical protein